MPPIEGTKNLTAVLIAALIGGGGTSLGLNMGKDHRPDPFTGSEGRVMGRRLHDVEKEQQQLRLDLGRESRAMPLVRELEYRVRTLEAKCESVEGC